MRVGRYSAVRSRAFPTFDSLVRPRTLDALRDSRGDGPAHAAAAWADGTRSIGRGRGVAPLPRAEHLAVRRRAAAAMVPPLGHEEIDGGAPELFGVVLRSSGGVVGAVMTWLLGGIQPTRRTVNESWGGPNRVTQAA